MMQIQLIDRGNELCEAWDKEFSGIDNVSIHCADFFSIPTDCMVSPANSYGFMDGGLDLAISRTLGWQIQDRVQEKIKSEYQGRLLVGQALLVETGDSEVPFLISAPTMTVPLYITGTINAYLAACAIFRLLKNEKRFSKVSISGLGTGVGQLPTSVCAKQMAQAYKEVCLGDDQFTKDLNESILHYRKLL